MTEMIILAVVVVAFCGLCGVVAFRASQTAAEAKDFAQRTLNTTNEIFQRVSGENRELRTALKTVHDMIRGLRDEDKAIREEVEKVRGLIPEDVKEERLRRDVLMSQLNDELETRVKAEQEWNAMVSSVLGYDINKARAAGVDGNDK